MVERLLALVVLAAGVVYVATGISLPRGTAAQPGPGYYPLAVGAFGAVVALVWLVSAVRRAPAGPAASGMPGEGGARVAIASGLLVGYCVGLSWTGYPVAALLFTGLLLRGLGAGWVTAAVIGLASAVISYYLFAVFLGVPLPRGALLD